MQAVQELGERRGRAGGGRDEGISLHPRITGCISPHGRAVKSQSSQLRRQPALERAARARGGTIGKVNTLTVCNDSLIEQEDVSAEYPLQYFGGCLSL